MIKFECQCGAIVGAKDGTEGQVYRCAKCKQSMIVPGNELVEIDTASRPHRKSKNRPLSEIELADRSLTSLERIEGRLGCIVAMLVFLLIGLFVVVANSRPLNPFLR